MQEFYSMIKALVETTPNDLELGGTVRELIWQLEEEEHLDLEDANQINIFDVIAEEDEEDAIKGYD